MQISIANSKDLNSLTPLFDAYRGFYGQASDRTAARAWLETNLSENRSTVFVAGDPEHSRAVGFAQLYPALCSVDLVSYFVLYDLFVEPDSRRCGIGRALLASAAEWATAQGAARIDLETAHSNVTAAALYRGAGFEADRVFQKYSLNLLRESPRL